MRRCILNTAWIGRDGVPTPFKVYAYKSEIGLCLDITIGPHPVDHKTANHKFCLGEQFRGVAPIDFNLLEWTIGAYNNEYPSPPSLPDELFGMLEIICTRGSQAEYLQKLAEFNNQQTKRRRRKWKK